MNFSDCHGVVHLVKGSRCYGGRRKQRKYYTVSLACLLTDPTTNTKGYYDITKEQLTKSAPTCFACIAAEASGEFDGTATSLR